MVAYELLQQSRSRNRMPVAAGQRRVHQKIVLSITAQHCGIQRRHQLLPKRERGAIHFYRSQQPAAAANRVQITDGSTAVQALPTQTAAGIRLPTLRGRRGRASRGGKLRTAICVLRTAKEGNGEFRAWIPGVKSQGGMGLGLISSWRGVGQQALILIDRSHIMSLRDAQRVEPASLLRLGVE